METEQEQIWRHTEIDRAMKKILRSLLATDDAWRLPTAAHAIADAVKDCVACMKDYNATSPKSCYKRCC